ncbi:hypothetical protein [Gottfriedia acidiceleris]|uniref:hypothetical protein n=1 Tax=Gottfriedia acidiceleris TaxID=371036 RepID=UPI00101DC13A|nr:hypothetical protein [Gottfriedia acidiceleris]
MLTNYTLNQPQSINDGEALLIVYPESALSHDSGQDGKIDASYFKNLNFDNMENFAMSKLKESNPEYKEYKKNREPYALTSNNCATFSESVISKGGELSKPYVINPSPINYVDEYWEERI